MKAFFIFLAIIFPTTLLHCQSKKELTVAGGRMLFGTGDVPGYSINVELSKSILKRPIPGVSALRLGAEVSFENGVKDPKVVNPTFAEFFSESFYHVSNSVATIKLTYFPFTNHFLRHLNISAGPSIGYSYQSSESRWVLVYDPLFQANVRRSYLEYHNAVIVGYRISAGVTFYLSEHLLTGIRIDFASYNNGDINTLAAAKFGYVF
ncbi:MAG: hypothetical protein M3139_12220 [Bacteroidota bacterium]|nr:hypothetical protein [Bacteroidota bacterium]